MWFLHVRPEEYPAQPGHFRIPRHPSEAHLTVPAAIWSGGGKASACFWIKRIGADCDRTPTP